MEEEIEVCEKFEAGEACLESLLEVGFYIPESSFSCSISQVVSQQAFPRLPLSQALMFASIHPEG